MVILEGTPASNRLAERNGANLASFYPVVGSETLCAMRTDASQSHKLLSGVRDDLSPVVCFAPDGAMHVHSVSSIKLVAAAQVLHDRLVQEARFSRRPEKQEKFKGSHSDVFQSRLGSVSQ
jgi:hypothetical protein